MKAFRMVRCASRCWRTGFQTYGEDFDINKAKMEITIKLKRPQGQYSVYDDHPKDPGAPPKPDAPPSADPDKKPN